MNRILRFFKKPFFRNYTSYIVIAVAVAVLGVLSHTGQLKMSNQLLLEKMSVAIMLALSLSMVVGFLGELSLGHAGFMCVGAYLGGKTVLLLVAKMGWSNNHLGALVLAMVVGGFAAALLGFVIGLPALRLRGDYLAIVTLAFGEIVRVVITNLPEELFGGPIGMETIRFPRKHFFVIAFLLVLLCLAVTQNLIRSKHGRAIISIKDNEIAARATGVDITKYKLFVFTLSSFFAGIAGVMYSYTQTAVASKTFDYNYSIEILVMVVLGGMGSINGSMIAAALITFLNVQLQKLPGDLALIRNLVYALILITVVIYRNAPGLKGFRERFKAGALLNRWKQRKTAEKEEPSDAE